MTLVKAILFASATAFFISAEAQAADLRTKASAYLRVCSVHGVGFYYIPGTDSCIRFSGYARFEYYQNGVGGFPPSNVAGAFSRATSTSGMGAAASLAADVRTQTEYGALRSYFKAELDWTSAGDATGGGSHATLNRAFIQFVGFTFGRTESYFDFFNGAYSFTPVALGSIVDNTSGINVAAYTAQFGDGLSASIAAEDNGQRAGGVYNLSAHGVPLYGAMNAPYAFTATSPSNTMGTKTPDIVVNMRVDQTWGSGQIMGAIHQVGGHSNAANGAATSHPDDKWGWAAGAGLTLKMPWAAVDTFSMQAAYTEGAMKYAANGVDVIAVNKAGGIAFGPYSDAVFSTGAGPELTEAWSVVGAFEHYWTPKIRQSFMGGYLKVSYSSASRNTFLLNCATAIGGGFSGFTNCNPDWAMWRAGTRVLWNPVENVDVGVEVFYNQIESAFAGQFTTLANPTAGLPPGRVAAADQDFWTVVFRVQHNF